MKKAEREVSEVLLEEISRTAVSSRKVRCRRDNCAAALQFLLEQ